MPFKITKVYKKSPAQKAGFSAGDVLTHLGGEVLRDEIDFLYFSAEKKVPFTLKKPDGTVKTGVIKKREDEEIGIEYEGDGFGIKRSCANKCMFCFVDQLPENMRSTLYFKDDDWRMSFVMGNYVTLSNVTEKEFERILKRKVSPLYISVHATDPETRKRLIGNSKIYDILPRLKRLAENRQSFNCQAVLCPDINDGEILDKTIFDLYSLMPYAQSFAVVPVGLTKHRQGLCNLSIYTESQARDVIKIVNKWQNKALKEHGTRFVFASDEFYLRANLPFPEYGAYEDFLQLEDGVGLVSMLTHDAALALADAPASKIKEASIACGTDIAPTLKKIAREAEKKLNMKIHVYPVINRHFGSTITVSGLLCAKDIVFELKDKKLGERLLISDSMLRDRQNVFLDDVTLEQLCDILNVYVRPVCDGFDMIDALLGNDERM